MAGWSTEETVWDRLRAWGGMWPLGFPFVIIKVEGEEEEEEGREGGWFGMGVWDGEREGDDVGDDVSDGGEGGERRELEEREK